MTELSPTLLTDAREPYYQELMQGHELPEMQGLHIDDRVWMRLNDRHPERPISLSAAALAILQCQNFSWEFGYCLTPFRRIKAKATRGITFDEWATTAYQLAVRFRRPTAASLRQRLLKRGFRLDADRLDPETAFSHRTIYRLRGVCFPHGSEQWADAEYASVAADGSKHNVLAPVEVLEPLPSEFAQLMGVLRET